VGDSALIVDGTGKVVPPRDPCALAEAWRVLIELDLESRARLGLAARRRITENFSLPIIVARYQELYAELGLRSQAPFKRLPSAGPQSSSN
jgi:glycosyltransferase involved in cell wall biosynthesis